MILENRKKGGIKVSGNVLGAKGARIRLVQENVKRSRLKQYSALTPDSYDVFDFGKYKDKTYESDCFTVNLMFNPWLSANEIRLGYLLYKSIGYLNEEVFWLSDSEEYVEGSIGEKGYLYFTQDHRYELKPKNLLDLTKEHKLCLTAKDVIEILNVLHDFYFITCTEVSAVNLGVNRKGFSYKNNTVSLGNSAKMIHIRLNIGMDETYLVDKWKALK